MHKYAVAYSLFMISSASSVSASRFHVARQQNSAVGIGQSAIPPTSPPATTPPTQPPATPGTGAASTPPVATTPPAQPSATPGRTDAPSSPAASQAPSQGPSSATPTVTASSTLPDTATTQSASSTTPDPVTSTSINAEGQAVTTTIVAASDTSSATPTPTQSSSDDDNTIKPGTIIGLSVAGGIAALAVIAFIIWKLTRKRFSDLDDPDEAIKWPELNRGSPLGGDSLSRETSNIGPSRNASTLDQSEYADPYAVPPLPQFNPNQPYRDDPAYGASGYYDPYRGPVPQTFHDGSVDGHESIPMSTYPPGSRTRSPGPGPSYDMGGRGSPALGRASPAPGALYDTGGRGSPVPGRTIDPGPAAVLGLDRRPSPAPHQYAVGGQPEMVSRNKSPGPNVIG